MLPADASDGPEIRADMPAGQVPEGPVAGPVPSGAAPETPAAVRRIARQVASHPVLRTGGSAELSLAPEELGRLHLRVELGEAGLRVVIEAARPETAELMRRHVDSLRQELRQEGLGSVGVSIGGAGRRGDGAPPDRNPGGGWPAFAPGKAGPDSAIVTPAAAPRARGAGGHIDLRF